MNVLHNLIGLNSWGWQVVHGSIMTIEFGLPKLDIRQPIQSKSIDLKIIRAMARRKITPVGQWHLSFESTDWNIFSKFSQTSGESYDHSSCYEVIRDLDGQILTKIDITNAALIFEFDLGGILSVKRNHTTTICDIYFNESYIESII